MTAPVTHIPHDIAATLVDPQAYASDRIHRAYSWLRVNNALGIAEPDGFDPFWVVTRHKDIAAISRQNALFHSGDRSTTLVNKVDDVNIRAITGGSPHLVRSLIQMDEPDHRKYRALTFTWFAPKNIKLLEDSIRSIARSAIERMASVSGACDFVNMIALHYPLHVIMRILGVPEADEAKMLTLTQDLFGTPDEEQQAQIAALPAAIRSQLLSGIIAEYTDYFGGISADRRRNPREDLASAIANATIDGQPISELEATGYYMIIATAGHDTTSSSLAGGIGALAQDPALFARMKTDPALIPGFVDEAIRWTSPVKTFMRTATQDTELAGRTIRKGDWLMLCYASGNRDEEVFEEPFAFRPDRPATKHIAFGYGAHVCLGQHLARLELRIFMEELLPRLKSIEADGPMQMTPSWFVNGPSNLPIRYEIA
jgi:cytochrome P450